MISFLGHKLKQRNILRTKGLWKFLNKVITIHSIQGHFKALAVEVLQWCSVFYIYQFQMD